MQHRAIATLLAASAVLLGLAATRDAIRAPDDGLDGAARRNAGLLDVTRTVADAGLTKDSRYVLHLPAAGGRVRPGVARLYLATALLPAAPAAHEQDATTVVEVSPEGEVVIASRDALASATP